MSESYPRRALILPTVEEDNEKKSQFRDLQLQKQSYVEERSKKAAEAYFQLIQEAVLKAYNKSFEKIMRKQECTCINLAISLKSIIDLESDDKSHKWQVPIHEVHYGGKMEHNHGSKPFWTRRVKNPDFENLFKGFQRDVYHQRGFYLLDVSDSSKGFGTYIRLYFQKPVDYDTSSPLWHGLNKLPDDA